MTRRKMLKQSQYGVLVQIRENGNGSATASVWDCDNSKIRERFFEAGFAAAVQDFRKRGFS